MGSELKNQNFERTGENNKDVLGPYKVLTPEHRTEGSLGPQLKGADLRSLKGPYSGPWSLNGEVAKWGPFIYNPNQ